MFEVSLYDSTLRDGAQAEGISFSLSDKMAIAQRLDNIGIDYIEGGFAVSSDKDRAFFEAMAERKLEHAKLVAFGSTRRAKLTVENDPGISALLAARTPAVAVVGKSWDLHVRDVLRVSLEENLSMIADTVRYLRQKGIEVVYDAEHFYDGYRKNPTYAMKTLRAAMEGGAAFLVLCDTNGGSLPRDVLDITATAVKEFGGAVGFHGHNDDGMAVANSIAAVESGAVQVQGTVNGLGERSGNADLCQVIPNIQFKLHKRCMADENLRRLTELSRFVAEVANVARDESQPYVGLRAFAHKGGLHVDAVKKNPLTYEHIAPELVGNERRILLSELSGKATMLEKMEKYKLTHDPDIMRRALEEIQHLENRGYQFEAAEASFTLLVKRLLGRERTFFDLMGFRIMLDKRGDDDVPTTTATVKVRVGGKEELSASEGDGPVNALDGALRNALYRFYPNLKEMHLVDYKVRVINPAAGTAAAVRVVVESHDKTEAWGTVGVSENLIEASWRALVDSIVYKLSKDEERQG